MPQEPQLEAIDAAAAALPTALPAAEKNWTSENPGADEDKTPVRQTDPAYWTDPAFFRLVILFSGWVLVLAVGGMLLLAANDKDIPQGVVAVASGLVGLLTGIFAAKTGKV